MHIETIYGATGSPKHKLYKSQAPLYMISDKPSCGGTTLQTKTASPLALVRIVFSSLNSRRASPSLVSLLLVVYVLLVYSYPMWSVG